MDKIKDIVTLVNPSQVPVIAADPYAVAKKVQWKWPKTYGEDKSVISSTEVHRNSSAEQWLDRSPLGGRYCISWNSKVIPDSLKHQDTTDASDHRMQSVQGFEGSPHRLLGRGA